MQPTQHKFAPAIQKTLASLTPRLDIVFCIDGSSSVNAENFELQKLCTKVVAMRLPMDDASTARVAFLQFTHQVHIGSPFTNKFETLAGTLAACKQVQGGTSAKAALLAALNMFALEPRNCSRAIVLLTDGDVNDAIGVKEIAVPIAQQRVKLIVCGIGLASQYEKNVIALAPDCAAFFSSFIDLQNCMMEVSDIKPADPPRLTIRTTGTTKMSFDVVTAAKFVEAELQVREVDANKWTTAAASQTAIVRADNLKPSTTYHFQARVRLAGNSAQWTPYSAEVAFTTHRQNPHSATLRSKDLRNARIADVRTRILNLALDGIFADQEVSALNVLIIGRMANGKSCFINTSATALSGKWSHHAVSGEKAGGGTMTLKISKHQIVDAIKLWDTFGWDGQNWPETDVSLLVSGRLKEGFEFGKPLDGFVIDRPQIADKVHAAIIVCDLISATSEQQMRELGKFYHWLTARQLQPIIVLTKPDAVTQSSPEERLTADSIETIYDNGLLEISVATFCKLTKISRDFVFPVLNYTGCVNPTVPAQDLLALFALEAAVDHAKQFVVSDLQRNVRLVDAATNQRVGDGDFLLKEGELDSPVSLIREGTVSHVKFVDHAGLVGYQFLTKNKKIVGLDEERAAIKVHQCRVKDSEQRYLVYVTRNGRPAPSSPPTTPAAPAPGTPAVSAAPLKLSLRWQSPDNRVAGLACAATATAADLRALISDGVEAEFNAGPNPPYAFALPAGGVLPRAREVATPVTSLFLPNLDRAVMLVTPPADFAAAAAAPAGAARDTLVGGRAAKVSVLLLKSGGERESIGFLQDVDLTLALETVRMQKLTQEEVEDVPKDYRFLDTDGDPVAKTKEKSIKLEACVRRDKDGALGFCLAPK